MSTKENPYNEQIMRCSSLAKFPLYPQGVKELRETLRRHAGTVDRAAAVIDIVMEKYQVCPTPREIVAIALELQRQAEAVPTGCEICEGKPWVSVQKLVWEFPKAAEGARGIQYLATGAERCRCSLGQWFRMKDREYDAKREMGLSV